jgi:signal peptidase I
MTAIAVPSLDAAHGRHRRPEARRGFAPVSVVRRTARAVVGLVLSLAALASIALAVVVGVEHLGFSPVLSPSMQPSFAPGDLVVTKPIAAADLRVGDVAVLPVPGEPGQRYVHRIVKITYQKGLPVVRTKGDANSAPETFNLRITSKRVPLVVRTVPHLGRFALLLRGGIWRTVGVVVIAFLLLVAVKRALLDR